MRNIASIFFQYVTLFAFVLTAPAQAQSDADSGKSLNEVYRPVKWRCIGPFRGGRSVCASGVIGHPQTYYMGTTGGGVWKTTNAGHHWKNISDGFFKTGSVGAVAVSESHPNVVYVGMGEHAPRGVMTSHGDGVYKSTDGGKTWKHLGLEATQHIARIVIHPDDPDIVYVAAQGALHAPNSERGIFKSTDGGKTWRKTLFVNTLTGCSELSMDMTNPDVLYATMWEHQRKPWIVISGGEGSGVYKSTDAGATWRKIHEGLPNEKGKMAIAVCRSNPDKVYALVESDSQKKKAACSFPTTAAKNGRASAMATGSFNERGTTPKSSSIPTTKTSSTCSAHRRCVRSTAARTGKLCPERTATTTTCGSIRTTARTWSSPTTVEPPSASTTPKTGPRRPTCRPLSSIASTFGSPDWQQATATAKQLGLESSLRPGGRPKTRRR